jgi:hypothetical protein
VIVYVAVAYAVAWAGVSMCLVQLVRRERRLAQEARDLQAHLVSGDVSHDSK